MPSEPMDTVRLSNYGESVAYAHTLIELNAGFETPTGATFETVLWGNPAYTISRTDYEYGASGLIATYQNGNVTAPTRYETNVGYFDFATNKRYYYLKDQLGNVRAVVDETANVISWSDYHAYGAIREQNSGTSYDPYKMLNHELDIETSWYQHGARTYDPWLGQFLNVDPLREKFPNLSPYHYGFNNPLRFKDPSGMAGEDGTGVVIQIGLVFGVKLSIEAGFGSVTAGFEKNFQTMQFEIGGDTQFTEGYEVGVNAKLGNDNLSIGFNTKSETPVEKFTDKPVGETTKQLTAGFKNEKTVGEEKVSTKGESNLKVGGSVTVGIIKVGVTVDVPKLLNQTGKLIDQAINSLETQTAAIVFDPVITPMKNALLKAP